MSTRAVIARPHGETGFRGRYHHFDGYPSGLGRTLWNLYHGPFGCDLERMLALLIDQHPAGWRSLVDAVGWARRSSELSGAVCYCHGGWNEPALLLTEKNAYDHYCEFAYTFLPRENAAPLMHIRTIVSSDNQTTQRQTEVHLGGDEPDWDELGVRLCFREE